MDKLKQLGMDEVIHELVCEGRPLFAVCIGLQVLFFDTEEGGGRRCLGIIPGVVRKLPSGLKVPHMGWNQVKQRLVHPIFEGIPDEANFYFVHSYYADPEDTSLVAGTVDYGVCMCAVLAR
jgi:glutamine amidotransferase